MGVTQFRLGKKHAQANEAYMSHRRQKRYDSASAQTSYNNSYNAGKKHTVVYTIHGIPKEDTENILLAQNCIQRR